MYGSEKVKHKGCEGWHQFTSDGSLFQSGIVLIKKEFENGLFLV